MPRACVPHARFLAHAHLPLLPFLAPRVFTEAYTPWERTKNRGGDEDGGRISKKKDTEVGEGRDGETVRREGKLKEDTWRRSNRAGSRFVHGGMLHSGSPGAGCLRTAMGMRYADISSFAREQLRSYGTRSSDGSNRKVASVSSAKARRTARSQRRPKTPNEGTNAPKKTNVDVRSIGTVSPAQAHRTARRRRRQRCRKDGEESTHDGSSILKLTRFPTRRAQTVLDMRRCSALRFVRRRLNTYRLQPGVSDSNALMADGRYRSYRRRYVSFSQTKRGTINLILSKGVLAGPKGRLHAFSALDRGAYPSLRRSTHRIRLRHDEQCPTWTAKLLQNAGNINEHQMLDNWMSFDEATKEAIWPYLLIYLLHLWPGHALPFIRVLMHQPGKHNESEMLADAVGHLAVVFKLFPHKRVGLDWSVSHLAPTFSHLLRSNYHSTSIRYVWSQDFIYHLATVSNVEDLKEVFNLLEERNVFLTFDTNLHYANKFARAGETQYALRCLAAMDRRAKTRELSNAIANLDRFRWTCALILRKSSNRGDGYHETTGIVAAFVELGIKLDTPLYNAIMHNAMDAGDYSTAFKVYNSLQDNGLEPNKYTYSIMLHGCTMTPDASKFVDFAEYCARVAKETRDPWLAADYLYYLYVCQKRRDQEDHYTQDQNFARITKAYAEFFSNTTLRLFNTSAKPIPASFDDEIRIGKEDFKPMEPLPMALYIIIQTQIQRTAAADATALWYLYLQFRQLVRTNAAPVLTTLSQNPIVWNAFLLAFVKHHSFKYSSQLVKDMTDHSPQPNVYSWNIFMQGFFKAEQPIAAARVFDIMRARGVKPDQYSWGTLLRGYVRAQHIEKIGEAMEWVQSEAQMDPSLVQALGRIHNRKLLMMTLEKSQKRRDEREVAQEQEKAKKREERWREPFSREGTEEVESATPPPTFRSLLKPKSTSSGSFGSGLGYKSV